MIHPFYINSAVCISAQETMHEDLFNRLQVVSSSAVVHTTDPVYKDFIPAAQIRRMSKAVKMSMVASQLALQKAGVPDPGAIIVGTGMGCIQDSEKFLKNVLDNNETFLTPTFFIQSTHNTVAGQIALGLGCHAYNFTYVNPASSLEFSLLDAGMHLTENPASSILVGATDETSKRTIELYQLNKTIIADADLPADILKRKTTGVIWFEGAGFFVAESQKKAHSMAKVIGIDTCNELSVESVPAFIRQFLHRHRLQPEDIDAIMLGYNGHLDFDNYYDQASAILQHAAKLYWKHLSGEFNTASGFALFMACEILKRQTLPDIMKMDMAQRSGLKTILIYNQLQGRDHSLVLLERP